ncbi:MULTISPECIES: MBL fold metallo-hydrolase [unclassified Nitratiruptor]|uniref:MBL fold metallo-hydrolase n=1 Tax=unclassified Nitratiruptor TaxID=2624044 RepID=UPI0019156E6F|nr:MULTISPECIES: MBL fold metallo-hydrolase [unclassified Nitratiruptor]BCD60238.1 hydroxyacylglutathione hydrolase [Nitratiruptor sp. YY08-10]BCD64273.1 hydroxyacylglutathione hydrolase [Nitratiruptor sp. YY08-14]
MQIKYQPMGQYQTNCYIVTINDKDFIVDPGVGATPWVLENVTNPVAILNTHGHFDHIWSNAELKEKLNIPIIIHEKDAFFLQKDQFGMQMPKSEPDILVQGDQTVDIAGEKITFLHFPGHTPGCSVIDFGDFWCSGDFIFKGSIGRVDFPYSDPEAMKESLKKFKTLPYDKPVYPGHGDPTSVRSEQRFVDYWLRAI